MSFLTILRRGIKTADRLVKSLESTVTFQKYIAATDGYSSGSFLAGVPLKAIVEWKEVESPSESGITTASRPVVLFLDIAALMIATLGDGIRDEDVIILADGTTGPTRTRTGFMDAGTGRPIYTEVYLG